MIVYLEIRLTTLYLSYVKYAYNILIYVFLIYVYLYCALIKGASGSRIAFDD